MKGKEFIVVLTLAVTLAGGAWFGREHVAGAWAIVKAKIALMTTTAMGAVDVHARESEQAAVDDGSIKARVEGALNRQATLIQSGIQVASVNAGTVLLRGNAATIEAHLLAVDIAARVPGVRDVVTEIVIPGKPAVPAPKGEASTEMALTGCIREVGSRYLLNELSVTGHALPEGVTPRKLILTSGDANVVHLEKHIANIVAVTGRVEATPTFPDVPTLVVSSLRHVSDICQQ